MARLKKADLSGSPIDTLEDMLQTVRSAREAAQVSAAGGGNHAPVMAALRLEADLVAKIAEVRAGVGPDLLPPSPEEVEAELVSCLDQLPEALLERIAVALGERLGDLAPYSRAEA